MDCRKEFNMNTNSNTNKIKNISDEIVNTLIDKQITYKDAQEIIRIVLKKIERVEINSSSLKVLWYNLEQWNIKIVIYYKKGMFLKAQYLKSNRL